MRVLLLDVNCKYSSTGKIVYSLYNELNNRGYQAAICYGRGKKINEPNIYKFGIDVETWAHAGLSRITGLNGYFSLLSTIRLLLFIEKYKPDVIHIHELHAYFVNYFWLLKYIKKRNIQTVWTFHCEYMYTGKCGHANECHLFRDKCGNCHHLHEYPKSLFFDFTKKMLMDKKRCFEDFQVMLAVPSKWSANRVKLSFLKDRTIRVVFNGVDTNVFFQRSDAEISQIMKKYGIAGSFILAVAPHIMDEKKGGGWILRIAKHIPELNFVLIGAEQKNGERYGNVVILPVIEDANELACFYSKADLFLLCSARETFSMTCAEALCCGTLVRGFKCGAPETIFEAPYAQFFEYGDLENLVGNIKDVVKKKNIDRIACSKYGTEHFSEFRMAEEYIRLYRGNEW